MTVSSSIISYKYYVTLHQIYFYADDINLLDDGINTTKGNIETLLEASRDIGLEIKAENIKFMIMSRHQNSG
jgi:hypothetical protein